MFLIISPGSTFYRLRAEERKTGTSRRSKGAGGRNPAGRWSLCPGSWLMKNHWISIWFS